MPVQIEQLDLVPTAAAAGEDPGRRPPAPAQAAQAADPRVAREIAATLARLRSRELRLRAD